MYRVEILLLKIFKYLYVRKKKLNKREDVTALSNYICQ